MLIAAAGQFQLLDPFFGSCFDLFFLLIILLRLLPAPAVFLVVPVSFKCAPDPRKPIQKAFLLRLIQSDSRRFKMRKAILSGKGHQPVRQRAVVNRQGKPSLLIDNRGNCRVGLFAVLREEAFLFRAHDIPDDQCRFALHNLGSGDIKQISRISIRLSENGVHDLDVVQFAQGFIGIQNI